MTYLIIFILIVIILILVLIVFRRKDDKEIIYKTQQEQEKEQRKEKILDLFNEKQEITNNDVEKMLGVSDATATNYLQELENQGKIEQIGKTGRAVYYRLRQ